MAEAFTARDADYLARARANLDTPVARDFFRFQEVHIAPGEVDLAIDLRPELGHAPGWFQGSVTTAIAEIAAGVAALTLCGADQNMMTVDQSITFTGPARGQRLVARGRVVRPGRSITVCQCEVFAVEDGAERLCAIMLQTNHQSGGR